MKKWQERDKPCLGAIYPEPPVRQWRHADQAQLTAPCNWHSFDNFLTSWDWCQDCPALIEPSDKTNRTLIRFYGQEIGFHSYFRISLPLLFTPSMLSCMQALASVYNSAFHFISCPSHLSHFLFSKNGVVKEKITINRGPSTHTYAFKPSMKWVLPRTGSIESMLQYPEITNTRTSLYHNRSCVALPDAPLSEH